MRRGRALAGLLLACLLVAGACGSSGGSDDADGDGGDEGGGGAAAVVDGDEISQEDLDAQYDQVATMPAVAGQLEAEGNEALAPMLRAQVLTQLVVSDILFPAAEADFGIEVTEDDVQARFDEMVAQAGGPEAFAGQLEQSGMTEDLLLSQELPLALLIEQIQAEFADEAGGESPPPTGEEPSAADMALQEWAIGHFNTAEVSVLDDIGTWNPETGEVQPPAAAKGPPPADDAPPTGEDEDPPA